MLLNAKALLNKATVVGWGYDVSDEYHIILDPGKFEGEPFAAVLLWDTANNGFADYTDEGVVGFECSRQDLLDYGLGSYIEDDVLDKYYVELYERDDGFVFLSVSIYFWDFFDQDDNDEGE